jgi:Flp pilus assembly protein TadG
MTFASALRRLPQDRRGAAAVEFALVVPAMMCLLFGTFEYGVAFFSYATTQAAVRDVTRQVAVNTLAVGSAESAIRSRLPAWARSAAAVTVSQSSPANPATNVYTVVVSMPMSSATPLQFFTLATNPTLRTELRMKQEMPYVAIQ